MQETDLFVAVISVLRRGFDEAGLEYVQILRDHQPTDQGRAACPTLYLNLVAQRRYGFTKREDRMDADTGYFQHVEVQDYETTMQAMGVLPFDADIKSPGPLDLTNMTAAILGSDTGLARLRAAGLGLLRITDVRNPKFINDRGHFEASPSFDFVLTHEQIMLTRTPAALLEQIRLGRV